LQKQPYYKQQQQIDHQQFSEQSISSKQRIKKPITENPLSRKNPYIDKKQDYVNFKSQANNMHQFQEKVNLEKAYHTI
jgi:hypothetical protein